MLSCVLERGGASAGASGAAGGAEAAGGSGVSAGMRGSGWHGTQRRVCALAGAASKGAATLVMDGSPLIDDGRFASCRNSSSVNRGSPSELDESLRSGVAVGAGEKSLEASVLAAAAALAVVAAAAAAAAAVAAAVVAAASL
eukprot:6203641-Pleurochrysis_carterae.AAC.5